MSALRSPDALLLLFLDTYPLFSFLLAKQASEGQRDVNMSQTQCQIRSEKHEELKMYETIMTIFMCILCAVFIDSFVRRIFDINQILREIDLNNSSVFLWPLEQPIHSSLFTVLFLDHG